jgi:hypothetical protein
VAFVCDGKWSEPAGKPPSPADIAKLVAVAASYGVDILGPLPEETS